MVDSFAVTPIPRIECSSTETFRREHTCRETPAIITDLVNRWPAFGRWTPDYFAERFGSLPFTPSVDLPTHGTPYTRIWSDFHRDMTVAEFVAHMKTTDKPSYVRRQGISKFPGAQEEVGIGDLSPDSRHGKNTFVWFGRNTITGLHFDLAQGLFCQMYGNKRVYMIAPEYSRFLYPVRGSVTKSLVLPSEADLEAFPQFQHATVWTGTVHPGELLVIPRLWWHSIIAEGTSITVTHDFGEKISASEIASAIWAGGARQAAAVARDFIWHGILHRPFRRRLFDDPPFGQLLYSMLAFSVRSRLRQRRVTGDSS
jgi:hypothetical protein